jgi:hypothetical protein
MDIDRIYDTDKELWVAEVWEPMTPDWEFREPYPEETYVEMNRWCIETLGYHARTAYHVFEFSTEAHLNWFIMRWK